jgi:hypothetical protein
MHYLVQADKQSSVEENASCIQTTMPEVLPDEPVEECEQKTKADRPNCKLLKEKVVKLQKEVSYLKRRRSQLYSRIEEVCAHVTLLSICIDKIIIMCSLCF